MATGGRTDFAQTLRSFLSCPACSFTLWGALMRRSRPVRALLAGMTTAAVSAGLVVIGGGAAHAAAAGPAGSPPMPAHVAAPYFETWTGESPASLAAQ